MGFFVIHPFFTLKKLINFFLRFNPTISIELPYICMVIAGLTLEAEIEDRLNN